MSDSVHPYDRVEFEYSLEEAAAFQIEYLQSTREGKSWRKREQSIFVIALIASLGIFAGLNFGRQPVLLAMWLAAITVFALVLAGPFGIYYDHLVRRRTARIISEQMGPGPYRCSTEIHPDALRVAQSDLGYVFPWSGAMGTADRPDGILVAFKTGRVLARSRGFTSDEHRQYFLQRVRELAGDGIRES